MEPTPPRQRRATLVYLDVSVERLDGTALVCPVGELDLATAPELDRVLQALAAGPSTVVLDLSGLTFVDCAGLRPVREAILAGAPLGRRVRLSGARPAVRRVLELTGLDGHLAPTG